MKTGLYIGRFQPFHLGHLSAVQQALKQVDKLYIAIGSSQYHSEEKNPYTAQERAEMIRLTLEENDLLEHCEVFEVPDIHDDGKWTSHVRSIAPPFETVFLGNHGLVHKLFKKEGKARLIQVEHKVDVSATKIRRAMKEGKKWETMVSPSIVDYLSSISASPGHK